MIGAVQTLVRSADSAMARLYLSLFRERSGLSCFLFHSLFRNEREMERDLIDPLDRTTVAHLRQLIEYYLQNGYRFVAPDEIPAALAPGQKYAMLTFDDGYFNNSLALPLLEEFDVPALFFISTNHVRQNKCFWWDVLYRERRMRGASPHTIYHEALAMKVLRTEEIESQLTERFGDEALRPRGDIDRPFTTAELRRFAQHPLVHLGNHTADHAILTNYTPDEIRAQIAQCQRALTEMTGNRPLSIAYPNGAYNRDVLSTCRDEGIRLGFTIKPHKNILPVSEAADDLLTLGRFVPHAQSPMPAQCRTYRSDVLLYGALRAGYLRLARGRISN
jgi:peptidoglycan/xylan/chitin deacetylase (PgdA/CDA1 family)